MRPRMWGGAAGGAGERCALLHVKTSSAYRRTGRSRPAYAGRMWDLTDVGTRVAQQKKGRLSALFSTAPEGIQAA